MPRSRRIGNKSKERFKTNFNNIINNFGRKIFVYLSPTTSECPNCYYDKKSRKSSGVAKVDPSSSTYFTIGRCPVCLGDGVIKTERRRCIKGTITWNPVGEGNNTITFTEAGYEGATVVQLKTNPCYLDIFKAADHVVVDGLICKIATSPIIRGVGNKAILVIELFTTDKLKIDSGEILNN
jgi:hypothetical protein